MASTTCLRKTSACKRNVVVSDQLRIEAPMLRPPLEKLSASTLVNGQGPAIQDNLAFRNSFPSPASRLAEATAAFHSIPGEHGGLPAQGTLPVLATSKVLTALPTLTVFVTSIE